MKIAISCESTCDLSRRIKELYDIKTIPFGVLLGDDLHYDGVDINPSDIFNYVIKTGILPKTSAVNEFQYEEFFTKLLKEYDYVIHISLARKISSAIDNARKVADKMKDVFIIDSLSLSTGIGLQAIYARELANQGLDVYDIIQKVYDRSNYVQASFVVNTLDYLYKGGRCSGLSHKIGKALKLKPQIVVDTAQFGAMVPGKKYLGKDEKVIRAYCLDTIKLYPNMCKDHVFITHSQADEKMVREAAKVLVEYGVPHDNIHITTAGATISSHCGPKTLGILYYNDANLDEKTKEQLKREKKQRAKEEKEKLKAEKALKKEEKVKKEKKPKKVKE